MNNKNLLIVAGVVILGYLLYKKNQSKSLESRKKQMECDSRYSELMQPDVVMPQEYWQKRKEDWMKINCK